MTRQKNTSVTPVTIKNGANVVSFLKDNVDCFMPIFFFFRTAFVRVSVLTLPGFYTIININMIKYRVFVLLATLTLFLTQALPAGAAVACFGHSPYDPGGCPGGPSDCVELYSFNACVPAIGAYGHTLNVAVPWLFWFIGAVGLLMFIKGAYQYLAARSDPDQIENAKSSMLAAIVGVLIIILSFTILEALNVFLNIPGWNIDLFNLPI